MQGKFQYVFYICYQQYNMRARETINIQLYTDTDVPFPHPLHRTRCQHPRSHFPESNLSLT